MGASQSTIGAGQSTIGRVRRIRLMVVSEPWYRHILEGRKDVEGRKNSETWRDIEPGDILCLTASKFSMSCFYVKVTGITLYAPPGALRKYLEGETLARALPGVSSIEEGMKVYLAWSTMEEIEAVGMMGIQLEVIRGETTF